MSPSDRRWAISTSQSISPRAQVLLFVLDILAFFAFIVPVAVNTSKAIAKEVVTEFDNTGKIRLRYIIGSRLTLVITRRMIEHRVCCACWTTIRYLHDGRYRLGNAFSLPPESVLHACPSGVNVEPDHRPMKLSCPYFRRSPLCCNDCPRSLIAVLRKNIVITLAYRFVICFAMPDVGLALKDLRFYVETTPCATEHTHAHWSQRFSRSCCGIRFTRIVECTRWQSALGI